MLAGCFPIWSFAVNAGFIGTASFFSDAALFSASSLALLALVCSVDIVTPWSRVYFQKPIQRRVLRIKKVYYDVHKGLPLDILSQMNPVQFCRVDHNRKIRTRK